MSKKASNRICSVEGCNGKYYGKSYCEKHYTQIRKHGKILDRTRFDANEIIIYDDYAEIVLYNCKNEEVTRALIDLDDIERVNKYKWHLDNDGYIQTTINNKHIRLHRFLMNIWEEDFSWDRVINHINHNRLDNRKSNLEIVTQKENMNKSTRNRKVIAVIDGKPFIVFDTIAEGSIYFNCATSSISKCCKGKIKSSGKYQGKKIVWRYLDVIEL